MISQKLSKIKTILYGSVTENNPGALRLQKLTRHISTNSYIGLDNFLSNLMLSSSKERISESVKNYCQNIILNSKFRFVKLWLKFVPQTLNAFFSKPCFLPLPLSIFNNHSSDLVNIF